MRLHLKHKSGCIISKRCNNTDGHIACSAEAPQSWETWHCQFRHISYQGLQELQHRNLVEGLKVNSRSDKPDCCTCIKAKQSVKPYPSHSAHTTQHVGELTHLDVWGKFPVQSIDKNQYFIRLIDDHTRYITVEGLSLKCNAACKVKDYILSLKAHGKILCMICYDEGGEFLSRDLTDWLKQEGITLQTTTAYSLSQNGVAKRMNCTLVELVCAMVNGHKLPKFLWELAIKHAAYLWNWAYTCICKLMPYQAWTREKLDVSHLREFGAPIWILWQGAHIGHKLELKSRQRLFVGFDDGTKVVKYYSPESQKILISRNYHFLTLPDTPLAVTKGIEIHMPDMQHEGEATGSRLRSMPQSNTDNMAGTLDVSPSGHGVGFLFDLCSRLDLVNCNTS
jgi:hypothetical protein